MSACLITPSNDFYTLLQEDTLPLRVAVNGQTAADCDVVIILITVQIVCSCKSCA